MSNICIIPARGGSKRIPRKNIRDFLGKPIIAYSIEAALESKLFDKVMVSTDDREIAKIAKSYGAEVPFLRSSKNADDFATTFDVIKEVLEVYEQENCFFEEACCIYSCAPFVTGEKLIKGFEELRVNNRDVVFPIMAFSFPIQRALKIEAGKLKMFNSKYEKERSQDLEKSYHDAGQFYCFKTKVVLESRTLMTENVGSVLITELEGQDIDNELDWELAELKYRLIKE